MLFCHQPTFQSCAFNEVDVVQTKNTTLKFYQARATTNVVFNALLH